MLIVTFTMQLVYGSNNYASNDAITNTVSDSLYNTNTASDTTNTIDSILNNIDGTFDSTGSMTSGEESTSDMISSIQGLAPDGNLSYNQSDSNGSKVEQSYTSSDTS